MKVESSSKSYILQFPLLSGFYKCQRNLQLIHEMSAETVYLYKSEYSSKINNPSLFVFIIILSC
jgi:hypothetical protein